MTNENEAIEVRLVAKGELYDPEFAEALERYGLQGAVNVLLGRRYVEMIEREFITGNFPEGADTSLGIIDIEV